MPPRAKGHRKVDANIAAGCRAVFCRIGEVILHVKRWGFIAVRLPLWREPETFDWIFHEKFLIQGLHGLLDERKGGRERRPGCGESDRRGSTPEDTASEQPIGTRGPI